jgi:excisionase family DNA binding protein
MSPKEAKPTKPTKSPDREDLPDYLTVSDIAKKLNISRNSVDRAIGLGVLPAYKGFGGTRVLRADLDEYIAANTTPIREARGAGSDQAEGRNAYSSPGGTPGNEEVAS